MRSFSLLQLCMWISSSQAFQGWQSLQVLFSGNLTPVDDQIRIAIIGSGIGGASAAFFVYERALREYLDAEITVFESQTTTGGRIHISNLYGSARNPIELGARSYTDDDWCMRNAVREVGLQGSLLKNLTSFGVFNGHEFILQDDRGEKSWWDRAWAFWKYGFSPSRFQSAVAEATKQFQPFASSNFERLVWALEPIKKYLTSADVYFKSIGISDRFMHDIVEPAARSFTGRNLGEQTALELLISMKDAMRYSVRTGNHRLIERLLLLSKANVRTHTTVKTIGQGAYRRHSLRFETNSGTEDTEFDVIIIASPFQSNGITLGGPYSQSSLRMRPFIERHVTEFTSIDPLQTRHFHASSLPDHIMTTSDSESPFFSIESVRPSCHQYCLPRDRLDCDQCEIESQYRILSAKPITNEMIAMLLGKEDQNSSDLKNLGVTWIRRQRWPYTAPQY